MTNYLEVTNLSKSFDSFQLHNISFTLPKGYIMGLIGPNGSGKTTTIKLILNMLKRTGGTVKVMGLDNIAEEQKVKSELGVVFDTNYFSDDWKVSQVEKSISVFYPNWDRKKFADMLRKFHIAPTKKVKELSKGMQMKLMLACAFSYDAKLLILDEPTSGLDPVSRDELLKILSEYIEDGEHSVLFSTHITGDLERAADYITYISYGELFFTGSKDDFVDMFRIVKGGIEELSDDLKNKAAGIRTFPTGFEALMKTEDISGFPNPTIYLTTKGGGVPQEDRQALTDEQVERLLDAIRDLPPYVFVMIGLYAGLRREEILALQWDSVYLDTDTPYLTVRRAWHTEHNRPVISDELKTKAAERNIPLPVCLVECLKAAKETSTSEYVVSNRDGEPLSYTQFKRLWQYIVTRTVKERSYYRYEDGKRVKHTVTPVLGEKAAHNGKVVYSLDFEVTPHQLRHTYITNLIHASVDPKTVQYLAGHESSKITMDIYAKVKYNRPDELVRSMSCAFASWDAAQ